MNSLTQLNNDDIIDMILTLNELTIAYILQQTQTIDILVSQSLSEVAKNAAWQVKHEFKDWDDLSYRIWEILFFNTRTQLLSSQSSNQNSYINIAAKSCEALDLSRSGVSWENCKHYLLQLPDLQNKAHLHFTEAEKLINILLNEFTKQTNIRLNKIRDVQMLV